MTRLVFLVLAFLFATPAFANGAPFDPKPWLEDLAQMHDAFTAQYADWDWAVFEREADLPGLFADAKARVISAHDAGDARAAFERLIRRLGDGHVEIHWPDGKLAEAQTSRPCDDFDPRRAAGPLAALAPGYAPIETPQSSDFPIGIIKSNGHKVGVIKIRLFSPSGMPDICQAALKALSIPESQPCDDACSQKIEDWSEAKLNDDFIAQIKTLETAGIDTLLVDVAGNGGGTEWADAAAQMLTSIRLKSNRQLFVRGEHWRRHWAALETQLRKLARTAAPADRAMLLKFAKQASEKEKVAATPCDASPYWSGKRPACDWLGEGFFITGLVDSADPEKLRGKPWAASVFIPMEYQYTEGLWHGPLIVLMDGGSASSSERFAGKLQDNDAALIMGEPGPSSVGGHTDGGTSTVLKNSGGVFLVPDISGRRLNGSLESGVVPDLLVGFRPGDGPHYRAQSFLDRLPDALSILDARH